MPPSQWKWSQRHWENVALRGDNVYVAVVGVLRKVPPDFIDRNLAVASNRLEGRPKLQ